MTSRPSAFKREDPFLPSLVSAAAWQTIRPLGQPLDLRYGDVVSPKDSLLIERGAVATFLDADGRPTCVGLMTAGEFVGLNPAISAQPSNLRTVAVADGAGLLFPRHVLRREWETSAFFREAVTLRAHLALNAARLWVLCQERHSSRQRLAALLLWLSEHDDRVTLFQETAGAVLNLRRTTVAAAASHLRGAGALIWRRGGVRILDRFALERLACACSHRHSSAAH